MQDPPAANIKGQKRVVHRMEHRFDWGYVALGVGCLAVAYVLYRLFVDDGDDDDTTVTGG